MELFKIFRENHPKCLSFDFGPPNENGVELKENADGGMPQPVSDEKLDEVFDGDDVKDDENFPNLITTLYFVLPTRCNMRHKISMYRM